MFDSFLLKRVPELWEKVAYPSLKPLGTWVPDLLERVKFMREVFINFSKKFIIYLLCSGLKKTQCRVIGFQLYSFLKVKFIYF